MFTAVLAECRDELEFLEAYRKEEDKEWVKSEEAVLKEKKKGLKVPYR